MNILFYHGDETCPTMGGIQRTTSIVAEELKNKYGHSCYNIYDYEKPYPAEVPRYKYEESRRMPMSFSPESIANLLKEWNIDVIVNQMGIPQNKIFRKAIMLTKRDCKLFYFHHNTPRRLFDLSFSGQLRQFKKSKALKSRLKACIKISLFPFYRTIVKYKTLYKNASDYRQIYLDADKFVLLSKYFKEEWVELTGIKDLSKLIAIPNARSFDKVADSTIIREKEKRVLIVARMIEFPKQILVALRVWNNLQRKNNIKDWKFDIVGTGPDLDLFKEYARRHNISNVTFYGRQESMSFFKKASIFLMPSIREGWPMTLMEAMQMGVVPVAFDSFGAVREIIANGETGFLIKPFDEDAFADRVLELIKNKQLRESMAEKAVKSTDRFTKEKVIEMWEKLLTEK